MVHSPIMITEEEFKAAFMANHETTLKIFTEHAAAGHEPQPILMTMHASGKAACALLIGFGPTADERRMILRAAREKFDEALGPSTAAYLASLMWIRKGRTPDEALAQEREEVIIVSGLARDGREMMSVTPTGRSGHEIEPMRLGETEWLTAKSDGTIWMSSTLRGYFDIEDKAPSPSCMVDFENLDADAGGRARR